MKNKALIICTLLACVINIFPQSVAFPDYENQRGYYTVSYLRYEAESGSCVSDGAFLPQTYDQTALQSEASNQQAVQLIAQNSYVQWTNFEAADGFTVRFSLPDNAEGTGTQSVVALYVNDVFVQNITLNSFWAWQYFYNSMSPVYPDNTPAVNKFPRMRFDETHVLLAEKIPAGATFKLVKTATDDIPYTIDFVELEEVEPETTFESIVDENKVAYSTATNITLANFINANQGKTIYIPAGRYEVSSRIYLNNSNNTKLIGAGMWRTELYFTASSDERSTYNQRGIEASKSNIVIDGLFLNTVNNKRYYNNDDSKQVGKGLMGSFGANSVIRNVWVEHFECGAWIENADNLQINDCRFRNNYADGINFCYGTRNSVFENSSLRNNGDDDLATWSRSNNSCYNNIFRYCTAEHNWRASSLGFFGGQQNVAHHILILDPLEAGFRVTCDFPGAPFSDNDFSEMHDISVYRGGCAQGTRGTSGDLWGNRNGALHLNASSQYDLQNFKIYNIDLHQSKDNGVIITSGTKSYNNVFLENININGTANYGVYFANAKGNAQYCNINYQNIANQQNTNTVPSAFSFTQSENCETSVNSIKNYELKITVENSVLTISELENADSLFVFDVYGKNVFAKHNPEIIEKVSLSQGIYFVKTEKTATKIFVE
ncbi:MAG: right-handed parallel beta-helix repeat-containing protein [Prevotellaceae bacterium]|jgi:hypothetical protein|nr:right-handed parallel beta-helix repeat-containing protein [Prevotellaceae bacterium]